MLSVTPVLVPVYGDLNAGFGERGHLNAAGKLYLLLYDTDLNPMRNYVYGRVSQPDAQGRLYLTLGGSAIVNVDDGSFALLPEVQYKATENLELRMLANVQRGGRRTEFGEKQANLRLELRVRCYF